MARRDMASEVVENGVEDRIKRLAADQIVTLAVRAALRTLPHLASGDAANLRKLALPCLRAVLTAGVALDAPAARAAAADAFSQAFTLAILAEAGSAAALSAARAASAAARMESQDVAYAAYAAAYCAAYDARASDAVFVDLVAFENGAPADAIRAAALWPPGGGAAAQTRFWIQRNLFVSALTGVDPSFALWVGWYEDTLSGWPVSRPYERDWALAGDAVWRLSPARTNERLREIRSRADAQSSP